MQSRFGDGEGEEMQGVVKLGRRSSVAQSSAKSRLSGNLACRLKTDMTDD